MRWSFFHKTNKSEIVLRQNYIEEASEATSWVRTVHYAICLKYNGLQVGECDLRLGMNEELYYAGQVGYRIYFPYRGNGFAYQACRQLFLIARNEFGLKDLMITCSPDNIPSHKTLQKLGGKLLRIVDVPEEHWLYARGETVKEIYYYNLM